MHHGPDGLSRRKWMIGDEVHDVPEEGVPKEPYKLEEFVEEINTRGGYLQDTKVKELDYQNSLNEGLLESENDFAVELEQAKLEEMKFRSSEVYQQFLSSSNEEEVPTEIPEVPDKIKDEKYDESRRSKAGPDN